VRAVLPKTAVRFDRGQIDRGLADPTRIVVKLAEDREGLVADQRIVAADVLQAIGDRGVRPFFAGLERELADLRRRQLLACKPGERPVVDLARWFEVRARDADDGARLCARLQALPSVEIAYPRELPMPPPGDVTPATPDFTAQQGYRAPAPAGFDANAICSLAGAWGRGVTLLDVEWSWRFDHEDLAALGPASLVGPPLATSSYSAHGLAAIGILAADPDQNGTTGLTPEVTVRVVTDYTTTGYSLANAIVAGLPCLAAGDVMLLEAQASTPLGAGPAEWVQADFDAIAAATQIGVIAVEAAGNGGVDLDSPQLARAFDLTFRDSGAILVGASVNSTGARAGYSCHGSRIDANGWGDGVVSTGYGDLFTVTGDPRQDYTATFAGTSSAAPMVAAAVVALRGAARAQLSPADAARMNGATIRGLLRGHGTAMDPGQGIGLRPDLAQLLAAANLQRGLRVVGEAVRGQSCRVELAPGPGAAAGDLFGLCGSPLPANQPLPAPFAAGSRLLLDQASAMAIATGTFASLSAPAVQMIPVPGAIALRGMHYYLQGFALQSRTGLLTTTNSAHLFVRL
jgi:serine protease